MLTAPAQSTAVPAPADDHETACREQTAHLDEKGFRPINGLLVLGELPPGVMGVTTVSALLSPISGSTQVPFHGHLRDLCDDLAATFGRSGDPRLTCVAAHVALPIGAGTMLALIVDLLVADAFVHAFPPGRGGRIAVSFRRIRKPGSSPSTIVASPYDPTVTRATMAWRLRACSSCGLADSWRSQA